MQESRDTNLNRLHYGDQPSLVLPAKTESFATVKQWLADVLGKLKVSPRENKQFVIAADEIFCNIVKYAYAPETEPKPIEISLMFDREKRLLSMSFSDRGIAFNPLEKDHELPVERIRNREPGGIGLFLVTQFMDELYYRREAQQNILTMGKILHPDAAAAV